MSVEQHHPSDPKIVRLRDYRTVLWATAALVALNVALTLPTGASKMSDQQAALVEKSMDGTNDGVGNSAGGGSDDIMTELAAAPVATKELSNLRGGFVTRSGLEISVGFEFKTFLDGQLRVHNIFNVVGQPGQIATKVPQTANIAIKLANEGPKIIEKVVPLPTNVVGDAVTPPAESIAQPKDVQPIVINEITNGRVTLVNTLGPGTKVWNSLNGGQASTVIENVADGITIEQFTSLSISITTPNQFISKVRSGQMIGLGREVSNVMRSALIGTIAR